MRRAGAVVAVVLLLAGAFSLGLVATRGSDVTRQVVPRASASRPWSPPTVLDEVRRELAETFYRPVSSAVLREDSVEEILDALGDPHTEYLSAAEYEALKNRTGRSYSGVGLTVGPAKEGLIVTSALEGPARQAGIRKGDIIVSIDGKPARGLAFEQSLALIKGEKGTIVRLTVRRDGEEVIHFTVVRQEIAVPAIRSRLIRVRKTKVGYLRVLSFPGSAAERVEQQATRLIDGGAKGLILDLRDNPGGLLVQAVQTVSVFLDAGTVCTIEGEHQARRVYEVSGHATYPSVPIVVLVNGGSASAAEIVAAALRDNSRSTIVGERTYGKASVQSIRELPNGAALKVTTATYRTPLGSDITGRGVQPRVKALDDPLTRPDEAIVIAEKTLLKQLS